jgi:hypothetical protein
MLNTSRQRFIINLTEKIILYYFIRATGVHINEITAL